MAAKVERPTDQKFLNSFYELADFNPNKRLRAAESLLKHEELETHKQYVLERLLKGLAAGKTAARFGFSMFLSAFLDTVKGFEFSEIVKKVEELLPINDEKNFPNAVGRHFVYVSLENTELFEADLKQLLDLHLSLLETAPYLVFAVVDAIVEKSERLGEAKFEKQILPSVKPLLNVELEKISLEGLLFLIKFSQLYTTAIKTTKCFDNKKLSLRPVVYERVLELIKFMEASQKFEFCKDFLIFAKKFGKFEAALNHVVLKFVSEGDECKSSERFFTLNKELFKIESFGSEELNILLSNDFITTCRKYSHRNEPSYKGHHVLIGEALEAFKQRVEGGAFASSDILVLIERFDNIENGNFDTKVGVSVRITDFLVSKLDGHDLEGFAKRVTKEDNWSYKRLIPAFVEADATVKSTILKSFLAVSDRSADRFNVGCRLLEHIFITKRHINVTVKEEDVQLILDVTGTSLDEKKDKTLVFVAACLKFLGKVAESDEAATEFTNDAREIMLFAKSTKNSVALVDFLLAILSKVNKIHKILVCHAVAHLPTILNEECGQFLVETITKGSAELEGEEDSDNEAGDFKPITEEERQKVLEKWAKEEEEGDDGESEDDDVSDEDDISDDEEDENSEIDPALVADMKKALGKFAATRDSDEDTEMDDTEIEELDKALGAALKKNTKKGRKEITENLNVFRNKVFDILTVFVSKADSDVVTKCLGDLDQLKTAFAKDKQFLPKIEKVASIGGQRLKAVKKAAK
ncbi:unnamed protein product [Bursaphelenchus okinawaensis]|uniref:Uncharacterized protein n=1 Tax=Bursaphelenchus okinawaensis TaxID=465554 RepID=A0A811LCE3_9BILA|nr:unnamed protein product [Bursaphelenchus okinawaensis]CAG9120329.1 unnamed protein product [Bursaphelenchus okinawaensis]